MLNEKFQDRLFEFTKTNTGASVKPPRWRKCVGEAAANLNQAISAVYVRNFFDENAKVSAKYLIESIRQSYKNILNNVSKKRKKKKRKN